MVLITLAVSIAPGVFLLWFYTNKDKYEKEPLKLILKIFFLGAFMVIPSAIIEIMFSEKSLMENGLIGIFIYSFFCVAMVEEILKLLAVKSMAYGSNEFNEPMDGIVYGISAALGFATLENIFYVFNYGIGTGFIRAVLSVPLHTFCGGLLGYYLGQARFNKDKERTLIIKGFVLASLMHGFYDFFLFSKEYLAIFSIPVVIWGYKDVKKKIEKALEQSPFASKNKEIDNN